MSEFQRVPIIDEEDASDDVRTIWAGVEDLLGRVPNFWRTAAHSPDVTRWLLPFVATIHREGAGSVLDSRIKNLAVLKTSSVNECEYCTTHNRAFGSGLGVTELQMDALNGSGYMESDAFDGREKAAIRWADLVSTNEARYATDFVKTLKAHFSNAEIVELTLIVGMFNMINRFNDSLLIDIEPTDQVERIRRTTVLDRGAVHKYARSMLDSEDAG